MGRIPKLVKEKALAEHHFSSSSIENDDPNSSITSSSSSPSLLNNLTSKDISLELIDEQFLFDDFDCISMNNSLLSCNSYLFPEDFIIDDKNNNHKENLSLLNNCTENFDESITKNVLERLRKLVIKITHPLTYTVSDYEELSFIRYLRNKMFDLCNTYNDCTRQLMERMNNMINLQVRFFSTYTLEIKPNRLLFRLKNFLVIIHLFKTYGLD